MSNQDNFSSFREYSSSGLNIQFPRFVTQDEAFKDFTATKRSRKAVKNQTNPGRKCKKSQQQKGLDGVRIGLIDDNLALIKEKTSKISKSKFYPIKSSVNVNQEQRSKEVRLVAYSLVKKGFGFNLFQQFVEQQQSLFLIINREKYKAYTISIVQKSFRKVEWFLRTECEKMITTMRHEQMRFFVRYLLRFNIYFRKLQAAAMAKFISLSYDLHAVTITQHEAVHFYKSALQILKTILTGGSIKPAKNEQYFERFEQKKTKKWNEKYDQQLIQFYQLNQNFPKIHKCFITIHPELAASITQQVIQNQFEKIFRQIFRKLRQCNNNNGFSSLIELNQSKVTYLMKSPTCNSIRLALLDFRQIDHLSDKVQINNIIDQINGKFDFQPQNATKKTLKPQFIKPKPTIIKPTKYLKTLDQEEAQDWSRSVSGTFRYDQINMTNRSAARPKAKETKSIRPNRYEQNSDEYSDS